MKRMQWKWLAVAACLCWAATTSAQMGMELFKRPNITDVFKPVVGSGGVYEIQRTDQQNSPKRAMEMAIVGKEVVDGKDGYWMEVGHVDERSSTMAYAKILVTKDDFQFHKMVFQQPRKPAMEMPIHSNDNVKNTGKMNWKSGTSSVRRTSLCRREHFPASTGKKTKELAMFGSATKFPSSA